jgi:hypothetical protein
MRLARAVTWPWWTANSSLAGGQTSVPRRGFEAQVTIVHHEFLFCLLFALAESSLRFPLQTYLAVASDIAAAIQSRSVDFEFPISLPSVKPEAVALQAQFKPLFPNLRKGAHPSVFFFSQSYPLDLAFVLLLLQGT